VDFDGMTHSSAGVLGDIVLARLVEAERERVEARHDATAFIFMVRELPDTEPPPPVYYDVIAVLSDPKAELAEP
jgi:hypothetical protein